MHISFDKMRYEVKIMNIYDRINKLLKDKKVTRKDLAKETGISYQTLSSLFYRQSGNMSLTTIKSIAEYFQVSVDYLVMGESFLVKEKAEKYLGDNNEIDYEILRISRLLPLKEKTALLTKAYELESSVFTEKETKK